MATSISAARIRPIPFLFLLGLLSHSQGAIKKGETVNPTPHTITGLGEITDLTAAPVNGSGKTNLFISVKNYGVRAIEFDKSADLPNDGGKQIIELENPKRLASGNILGNGSTDLVVTERQRFHVYSGADEWKTKTTVYNNNYSASNNSSLWVGNLQDLDNSTDILGGPVWIKMTPNGKPRYGYFPGPESNDNGASRAAALSQPGIPEIIFLAPNELRIFRGPFPSMRIVPSELEGVTRLPLPSLPVPDSLAIADYNNDKRLDIATSVTGKGEEEAGGGKAAVLLYFQDMPMGFTQGSEPNHTINGVSGIIATHDLNGDGLSDLVVLSPSSKKLFIFLQDPKSGFTDDAEKADQIITATGERLLVHDLNGDSLPDIVTASAKGTLSIFLHSGL